MGRTPLGAGAGGEGKKGVHASRTERTAPRRPLQGTEPLTFRTRARDLLRPGRVRSGFCVSHQLMSVKRRLAGLWSPPPGGCRGFPYVSKCLLVTGYFSSVNRPSVRLLVIWGFRRFRTLLSTSPVLWKLILYRAYEPPTKQKVSM